MTILNPQSELRNPKSEESEIINIFVVESFMSKIEEIRIIRQQIQAEDVKKYLGAPFEKMIKFVVDVEREILALGGEMHADAEKVLLEDGSRQENIWGANLYPTQVEDKRIEFTSLINIRPSVDNMSLEIMNPLIREQITKIVEKLIRF